MPAVENPAFEVYCAHIKPISSQNVVKSSKVATISPNISDTNAEPTTIDPSNTFRRRVLGTLQVHKGIFIAIASAFFFSCEDVSVDLLTVDYDVFQVSTLLVIVPLLGSVICIFIMDLKPPTDRSALIYLLLCGISFAAGLPLAAYSLLYMDLGDSIAVIYTMPIFAGIFGWIFVKEAMRIVDFVFTFISFVGVVLIARPPFIFGGKEEDYNLFLIGLVCGILSAISFALCGAFARKLSMFGVHSIVILFVNCSISILICSIACTAKLGWLLPDLHSWLIAIGGGFADFAAQFLFWYAFTIERVAYVSVAVTTEVIFSFIYQYFLYKLVPDWISIVGTLCILSACIGLALKQEDVQSIGEDEIEDKENDAFELEETAVT